MDSRVRMKRRWPRDDSGAEAVKSDARADPKGPTEAPEVPRDNVESAGSGREVGRSSARGEGGEGRRDNVE